MGRLLQLIIWKSLSRSQSLDMLQNIGFIDGLRVKEAVGDKSYPSHWVLMTRDIIPGSRSGEYFKECLDMITNHRKKTGIPYELPHLLEATASILMYYVKTGERLYS